VSQQGYCVLFQYIFSVSIVKHSLTPFDGLEFSVPDRPDRNVAEYLFFTDYAEMLDGIDP